MILHRADRNGITLQYHNTALSTDYIDANSGNTTNLQHIVLTKNGTEYKWYIDGINTNTKTVTNMAANDNTDTFIGQWGEVGSNYFNGEITSPAIFNRALTSTEITDLYSRGRTYNPYN